MRKPLLDNQIFKDRRARLASQAEPGDVFVFFSGTAPTRSNDTRYKFRVNSDFFYLTGYEEEEAIFIFRPGMTPETIMFVMPKDPLLETWEGFLFGPDLAQSEFGFDTCFSNTRFEKEAAALLNEGERIFYRIGLEEKHDKAVLSILSEVLKKKGRKGHPFQSLIDPAGYLSELRRVKDDSEISILRESAEMAAQAHIELMKAVRPGMNERELAGLFIYNVMKRGATGEAYNSIVASGNNATTLHYVFNDCECKSGEVVLVDAGAEFKYLASDITRCFPVDQKFSTAQAELYAEVLTVQKEMVNQVQSGVSFKELNENAAKLLAQSLKKLGFFKDRSLDEILEKQLHKKYYPHGLGHYLGIDVHDIGYYERNNEPHPFVPGVVLTIEPGLYVRDDDESAPSQYRGVGIRIEDDILVTEKGHEVLTKSVPKEIADIEALRKN